MHLTSDKRLDDGVIEREFVLGEIPGILWTPASASAAVPLILLGHPGGLSRMYPRLVGRARRAVASGFAAATIELPGSGVRSPLPDVERARADLRRVVAAGEPVGDDIIARCSTGQCRSGRRPWTTCWRYPRSAARWATRAA